MNLEIPKHLYGIYVLDSRSDRALPTIETLIEAGFRPKLFTKIQELYDALKENPPHCIFFHKSDEVHPIADLLSQLRDRLPETHFFILSTASGLSATWRDWGHLIFDCLMIPPVHPRQLVQAVQRAIERDAYMYQSEDLSQKLAAAQRLFVDPNGISNKMESPKTEVFDPDSAPTTTHVELPLQETIQESINHLKAETAAFLSSVMADFEIQKSESPKSESIHKSDRVRTRDAELFDFAAVWTQLVSGQKIDDVISKTTQKLYELSGSHLVFFFRHYPNRRVLVASSGRGLSEAQWRDLGVNLAEEPYFKMKDLKVPQKLNSLLEMCQQLTEQNQYWAKSIVLRDDVYGIFVIFGDIDFTQKAHIETLVEAAYEKIQLLDMQQYIHSIEKHDPSTLVLNRQSLQERLTSEMARSRRLKSPFSFLSISLDQYEEIKKTLGQEEAQMAMRALSKMIQPRSRTNDSLGRLTPEELGLILPHTDCQGASIKAERLRKLIASADFSRMLPTFPRLTISIGVSEYPSRCRDVDDLMATADDALWQIKNKVTNKVCVSTPIVGFEPDFRL